MLGAERGPDEREHQADGLDAKRIGACSDEHESHARARAGDGWRDLFGRRIRHAPAMKTGGAGLFQKGAPLRSARDRLRNPRRRKKCIHFFVFDE
jgi:hypothetical protein